ncbi:uncharacterized protein A4U43_C02F11860 [Asparagus officinalis]|uniref:Uncharacterized protein n=1 Tax=Asparagus officinalis TaxID=4686 RepID=A0A5P1FJJ1_ASPOF|nr:uncharacterized protein A4U43_C02F11860 [Asparagus officinalis]
MQRAYGRGKEDGPLCDVPGFENARMKLLRHVSFVDCLFASTAIVLTVETFTGSEAERAFWRFCMAGRSWEEREGSLDSKTSLPTVKDVSVGGADDDGDVGAGEGFEDGGVGAVEAEL